MSNLISGMVLVTKEYGDLHYLITTPLGFRVVDVDGFCTEFDLTRYEKAYIPESYDDIWTPMEGTEVIFE